MNTNEIILKTNNFVTQLNVCENALQNHEMIAIIGEPGYGKTTALDSFTSMHRDCVIYDRAQKSMTAKLFYSSIYNKFSGESFNPSYSIYYYIRKVANRFNENSLNKLLIIDEAGKFSPGMLEYIHELRDLTNETTGIILAGPEYFEEHIVKWKEQKITGIPEVYSRISSWVRLMPPTNNEKIELVRAHGIHDKDFEKFIKSSPDFRDVKNKIKNYLKNKA